MSKEPSIPISKKWGLNCSIDSCFVCGTETNIVIFGDKYRDKDGKKAQAPMKICTGKSLCPRCKKALDEGGVFIIECRADSDPKNPYRTGRLVAITKEAADRMIPNHAPINFMADDVFEKLFGNELKRMYQENPEKE